MLAFVGWIVAGAALRRYKPEILGLAAQRGGLFKLLAGSAILAAELVVARKNAIWLPLRGIAFLRRRFV